MSERYRESATDLPHQRRGQATEADLDIPFGSLDAAAMAELPYTFRQTGTCTRYYQEFFG
jgi:hypothetical protein